MAMPRKSFYSVLSEAIEDVSTSGFDTQKRILDWMKALEEAAEATLTSRRTMERMLRDALKAIYKRLVEKGGVLKYHPGVARYTLQKIKPSLRAELDRRIMASAELIKLNRETAIQKTLQRFSGWSTSIPKGGSDAVKKPKAKQEIKKALASLPFEERRVLIDQGHKLIAAISDIVAIDGGAIAAIWHSHWRQAGYDYREPHKERDGQVYLIRDTWASKAGYVKTGKVGYADKITQPGEEVFCRCYWSWLYNLRDLPFSMLTQKGKDKLREVRAEIARGDAQVLDTWTMPNSAAVPADIVIDAADDRLIEAIEPLDRLGYLRGFNGIVLGRDREGWHAQYDPDKERIVLYPQFFREDAPTQLHILLHEIGHRGQDVDANTYRLFKRMHLNRLPLFLSMANKAHLEDFRRIGKVDSVAAEIFAESYSRAMLVLEMPGELAEFWRKRLQ